MASALFGLACLLIFSVSQAVRDVFFGTVFQSVSFLVVAILAFGGSTVVFGSWACLRRPASVRLALAHRRLFLALNATTAAAWLACFFALTHLEPAVVNTLYTGVGPLCVLALSAPGASFAGTTVPARAERVAYAGVLVSSHGPCDGLASRRDRAPRRGTDRSVTRII